MQISWNKMVFMRRWSMTAWPFSCRIFSPGMAAVARLAKQLVEIKHCALRGKNVDRP